MESCNTKTALNILIIESVSVWSFTVFIFADNCSLPQRLSICYAARWKLISREAEFV